MFENIPSGFKSKIAIGTCVMAFGIFMFKKHPNCFNCSQCKFTKGWSVEEGLQQEAKDDGGSKDDDGTKEVVEPKDDV